METVCELNRCTGCMACVAACRKNAITIRDSLNAYNAEIDNEKCIKCGSCRRICQQNKKVECLKPALWKQGWAENQDERKTSSSGGAVAAISECFVNNIGWVCSCTQRNEEFVFAIAKKQEELIQFKGSKYVKSNPLNCYKEIKLALLNKTKVLFIGLPCQVAGLKNYIGEELAEYLFTIDLICHGTPSPQLLKMFLNQCDMGQSSSGELVFRKNNKFYISNGNTPIEPYGVRDRYSIAFLKGLSYTENCYSCKFADLNRVADITVGDSWGTQLGPDELQKGISLLLCQTDKGRYLIENSKIVLNEVDLNRATEANHQLREPQKMPENREMFFRLIDKGVDFNKAVKTCFPKICMRQDLKRALIKLGIYSAT